MTEAKYRIIAETCVKRVPAWSRGTPVQISKFEGLRHGCGSDEDTVMAALSVFWDTVIVTCDPGIWFLLAADRMLLEAKARGRVALVCRAGCDEYECSPPPPLDESFVELVDGEWRRVYPRRLPRKWDNIVEDAVCGLRVVYGEEVEEKLEWPRKPDARAEPENVVCTPDSVGACTRFYNLLKPLYHVEAVAIVYSYLKPKWDIKQVYVARLADAVEYAAENNAVLVTYSAWLRRHAEEYGVKTMTPDELLEQTIRLLREHPLLR